MAKATFVYQLLPGEKVKIFSPQRSESRTFSKEEFEAVKSDPKMSPYVQWVEHKAGDVGQHFQSDSGLIMDVLNKNGVRMLVVKDKE